MKKRIWSLVLCAALVLVLAFTLLPGKAAAAGHNEQLGLWFSGDTVYAKGNAIILEDGGDGYTKIKVGSSYVNFSQLTYSNGEKMYDVKSGDSYAAQLSSASIFGGWPSGGSGNTSITMNGGNVEYIYGGSNSGNMKGNCLQLGRQCKQLRHHRQWRYGEQPNRDGTQRGYRRYHIGDHRRQRGKYLQGLYQCFETGRRAVRVHPGYRPAGSQQRFYQ